MPSEVTYLGPFGNNLNLDGQKGGQYDTYRSMCGEQRCHTIRISMQL